MKLVIRGKHAVFGSLRSLESEIAVQFHHRMARLDGVVRVDLDLVILLGVDGSRRYTERTEDTESTEMRLEKNRLKAFTRAENHVLQTKGGQLKSKVARSEEH